MSLNLQRCGNLLSRYVNVVCCIHSINGVCPVSLCSALQTPLVLQPAADRSLPSVGTQLVKSVGSRMYQTAKCCSNSHVSFIC